MSFSRTGSSDLPKGPQGQKRKADVIGNAILIAKIATGEVEDATEAPPPADYHRRGGEKGGAARAAKLTPEERSAIAKKAAAKRWER